VSGPLRPRLSRRARLRHDPVDGRDVLLFPERGLVLSPSASEILRCCDGLRDIGAIVDALHARHSDVLREDILRDVVAFLGVLAKRRLIEDGQ
jgi:coenzyme PQQ biosynthesis protein PqqD